MRRIEARAGARAIPDEIIVDGVVLKTGKRPPLLIVGEPIVGNEYSKGQGVSLEGQTVVQDGNDWRRVEALGAGDIAVSSIEDPAVRRYITGFKSASELRPI